MAGSSSAGSSTTDMKDFEDYIPSSVEHERRYHIFLSFRGTDTRDFASRLYNSLVGARFNVFMDDKRIERGDNIGDILTKAIQDSTVHIPILSPYYATSTWCLGELLQIWACKSGCEGVRIIPLFYDVDPKDVRYQRGPYAEAFRKHTEKGRYNEEKMDEWKEALKHVSLLSGWCYKKESSAERFAWQVVQDIRRTLKINYFHVAKKPVGISARVEQVTNLLQLDKLDNKDDKDCPPVTVGIWGMGGLGKTTLCKALYNSIHQKFEATCFLFDIRTTALTKLQEQILFNLEGVKTELSGVVEQDKVMMKNYLSNRNRKALIILDDVDDGKQPDDLFGDWDGRGSRIIITTRDRQNFRGQVDMTLHRMEGLDPDQSLKLFCRHAFKRDSPERKYEGTTRKIVEACQGLPLSLEIIGARLQDIEELEIWSEVQERIQAL